jgi:hypothetical protein
MGRSIVVSQPADGRPYSYWVGSDGTRIGVEVILPRLLYWQVDFVPPPEVGINISDIYTWLRYPQGRSGPPGGIVSECKVTITPLPDGSTPMVPFYFVWETLQY